MALENYRDISAGGSDVNAGFQFEFYCSNCARKWKTPFKPYRMGQITGFLQRFAFLFGNAAQAGRITGSAADYGSRGAKADALKEAMPQAERTFSNCVACENGFCEDCLDAHHTCAGCVQKNARDQLATSGGGGGGGTAQAAAHACPNCRTGSSGGRFCAECGFDMASTHKSCPGCGTLTERAARFCGDCGHGF